MDKRPEFTIVAGPNGAGKSRLGPFYSSVKAFDGDALALELKRENPTWEDRWVEGAVITALIKQKEEALLYHKDFAFETNFTSQLPLTLAREFKNAGYKLSLIYFGLASVEDAMARVAQRVALGGHNIDDETVKQNYTEGIIRICASIDLFDKLLFIDGSNQFGNIVAIFIKKSRQYAVANHQCEWFNTHFKESFDKITHEQP